MDHLRLVLALPVLVGALAIWSSLPQAKGSEHPTSGGSLQGTVELSPEARPAQEPPVDIQDFDAVGHEPLTTTEAEMVALVSDRFAEVGMELPEVEVFFHDEAVHCQWAHGIYHGENGRHIVGVCLPDRGTFASDLQRRRTLTHELAHAWEQANLGDADRDRLLEILDAPAWYAPEADWAERGAERFAETVVWGLYDQVRRPVLVDASCSELHADFHAITGHAAIGPVASGCELQSIGERTS